MALGLCALVVLFFAATAVLPLTTMGDPAYDIPMLRARWYERWLVVYLHMAAILLCTVLAVVRRSLWAGVACGLLTACLWAMLTEEGRFIQYGDLIAPHDLLMPQLAWARATTLALSVGALFAVWRADVRR